MAAFPARGGWPILTGPGGVVFMAIAAIVWATALFWTFKLLGINDDAYWFQLIRSAVLPVIAMRVAWGTRGVVAPCAGGSLLLGAASNLRWSTKTRIDATIAADAQIEVEDSPPWWRTRRVTIAGDAWYLSPLSEPERFEHWLRLRPTIRNNSLHDIG